MNIVQRVLLYHSYLLAYVQAYVPNLKPNK